MTPVDIGIVTTFVCSIVCSLLSWNLSAICRDNRWFDILRAKDLVTKGGYSSIHYWKDSNQKVLD
jgi:hypothetical protein